MMRQAHQQSCQFRHVVAEVGRQIYVTSPCLHSFWILKVVRWGLVHCDVKPGNVILNNHGAVKYWTLVFQTVFEEQKKGVCEVHGAIWVLWSRSTKVKWCLNRPLRTWRSFSMKWRHPQMFFKEKKDPEKIRHRCKTMNRFVAS